MANKMLYVRVRDEKQQFRKDLIEYPTDGELKKDPDAQPRRFKIDIHGYDELGRPVCPIFEVEDCKEIQNAIHNDRRVDPRPTDDIHRNPDGLLIPSRLVEVSETDVDRFPKWIGHPTINMNPDTIYRMVIRINVELKKGSELLEVAPEDSPKYLIRKVDPKSDPEGDRLYDLYQQGAANAAKKREDKKEAVPVG